MNNIKPVSYTHLPVAGTEPGLKVAGVVGYYLTVVAGADHVDIHGPDIQVAALDTVVGGTAQAAGSVAVAVLDTAVVVLLDTVAHGIAVVVLGSQQDVVVAGTANKLYINNNNKNNNTTTNNNSLNS